MFLSLVDLNTNLTGSNLSFLDFINLAVNLSNSFELNCVLSKINSPDYYFGSVNLSDLELTKNWIKQEIGARNDWDTIENTFWEMKPNGSMGKSINKIEDLGQDWSISDVYYGL